MFAKLIKHEWMGCRGPLGVLCAITLASGLTVGLTTLFLTQTEGQKSYFLAMGLAVFATMAIGICAAGGFFYLLWRFYQSRFTDEGYLTFTLPVNNHQQLLAALANIFRGSALVFAAAVGAMLLAGLVNLLAFFPTDMNWGELLQAVKDYLPGFLEGIYWQGILQALLLIVTGLVAQVILLMFSVTVGAIAARKHKLLAAAAVYYGIGLLQTWGLFVFGFGDRGFPLWPYSMWASLLTIAAGYFGMYWLLEKKLNLA